MVKVIISPIRADSVGPTFLQRKRVTLRFSSGTCIPGVVLKQCLSSRMPLEVALRLLKIIEPYFVQHERMSNAELLIYGSKHLEQNSFFYCLKNLDIFFNFPGLF